ncbi:iron complex outermembrane receptor protein [Novosphingobium sp. PhB165]|uniref:TonB-dependent siderophore receptor n=1 Tax=Novosphingobium sp. PhB165 TaxID=2485105 RepID=UPI0010EC44DE|nr:TonB-dependent siderophore receptor [Novosphingobium sp. PhB165]TCM16047.1 iron complex outermembrane receptor protein [Novosphingobium sp. PhB165]
MMAVSILPAFAHAAAAENDDIVVKGDRPANVASSGTKSDTPIALTPQSISVIDSGTISDLGIQNLNQALRFVAGVTPETRGSSAEVYDQFKLRGFDAPTYLDGLKMFGSATGYATPQVDMSRLDRIEVVKGPASALYGSSSPGGFVNMQSKLPIDRDFYGAVSGSYGSYNLYRVDGDIGGKIGETVLWRINGSVNGADSQQDIGKRRRQTVSGAVTLGAGTPTTFTVLGAYSHDPYNGNYGVFPASGTLFDNPNGKISTKFYGGEPDDFFKREQAAGTFIFRHEFGDNWAFRASGRYQYVKSSLGIVYTSGSPVEEGGTVYNRASYATNENLNNWTFDNQLSGKFSTGPLEHNVLFGLDRQVAHSNELYAFGSANTIDAYNPVYGTMPTPRNPYEVPGFDADFNYDPNSLVDPTYVATRQRQQGVYAQDRISVGKLDVTLSGRQDWARLEQSGSVQHDRKFTWRAAALYKTDLGLSPYVTYSTSFEPQSAILDNGELAKPSLGKQIEAGAKYVIPGTDILLTGAWFQINQTNVVVSNPVTFASFQSGEVRSRGVEVEASGSLPYDFNFRLAFSSQNVKVLKDVNPDNVGKGLATVGKGGISANLAWEPREGTFQGLSLGGAVRHVDKVYAGSLDGETTIYTPAYTVFDGLIRYNLAKVSPSLSGVTLGLNATNIFDKKYLTSCFAAYSWCWYGNRRTVQGTIGFTW